MAMRLSLDDSGANITGTPRFVAGILNAPSSGVANGPLSASTSHFVGMRTRAASFVRAAGPPVNYLASTGMELFKRVGTTNTTTAIAGNWRNVAEPTSYRWPLVLEIEKGSPNYTLTVLYWSGAVLATDFTEGATAGAMEPDTMAQAETYLESIAAASFTTVSGTIAVDEGVDGSLNALVFGWNQAAPLMHFSDIHFKVLAS
jgi:hypothetical protein